MESMYGLKIMYYDWPINRPERIGFPKNRYQIAANIVPGTQCLIYLTAPIKRIVTATKITGTIESGRKKWPNHEQEFTRWPYVLPHELILPTKRGIFLKEIRELLPNFGPRPGDTYIKLPREIYIKMFSELFSQQDFDWVEWLEINDNI
ncbi:MAG: hypothetical protein ACYC2T_13475 [Bacillota bacterium]